MVKKKNATHAACGVALLVLWLSLRLGAQEAKNVQLVGRALFGAANTVFVEESAAYVGPEMTLSGSDSCDTASQENRSHQGDFYPLRLGNQWHYQVTVGVFDSYDVLTRVVGDTVMPNGKCYFIVHDFFPRDNGTSSRYERISDSWGVYQYSPHDTSEVLIDHLNAGVGTMYRTQKYDGPDCSFARVHSITRWVVFGDTALVKEIWYWGYGCGESDSLLISVDYIGSGFGLILRLGELEHWGLQGAVIDGKRYGSLVSVGERGKGSKNDAVDRIVAYPNPFNQSTTIAYHVSMLGHVKLQVFDILGEEVVTLADEVKLPGSYRATWDGRDEHGSAVASGIYLCRLHDATGTVTLKLVLIH